MKTINELRDFGLKVGEVTSYIKYFKGMTIDWDVYLPTIGKNLQRGFVWTIEQKRELIWSILYGRHIPHMAFINTIDVLDNRKDVWLIIDGKQRLSTIFDFTDDKFTLIVDDKEYLFSELPKDYQTAINGLYFRYYLVNEEFNNRITDYDKITWFKFINFSGTPQDIEHMKGLV